MKSYLAALLVISLAVIALLVAHKYIGIYFAWYIGACIGTFFVYWEDKVAATNDTWRTSEATLHFCSLIGGWPGAALAIIIFRHKSSKCNFIVVLVITIVVNCLLLYAFIRLRDANV